jgi:hypothetical protein
VLDANVSQGIYISDMTISYAEGSVNNRSLISLDNSKSPVIKNVQFSTQGVGPVTIGGAISIRSQYTGTAEETALGQNAHIENCSFENFNIAVSATGTVKRTVIENC